MAVTVFPKPSGWAAGATDIAFDIATTDWTAVTGGYQAEVTNQLITASSIELVTYTESIEQLNGNISKTKDAANHKMIFTVSALPSGTISGNICAIGSLSTSVSSGEKGAANGIATLDGNGLVPSNQLPSYVDDVEEYSSTSAFPATGEIGKIYVATDTNKSYRWSGSTYVELSSYAVATTTAAGLMSATDKTKLDGIATGATANVVSNSLSDTSTTNALSAAKGKELSDHMGMSNIVIDVTSQNYKLLAGAEALYNALPTPFKGVCQANFAAGYHAICMVTKQTATYGSMIYTVDYDDVPYYFTNNNGTTKLDKCALKSDFVTVDATIPSSASQNTSVAFPSGLNKDNCYVVSTRIISGGQRVTVPAHVVMDTYAIYLINDTPGYSTYLGRDMSFLVKKI